MFALLCEAPRSPVVHEAEYRIYDKPFFFCLIGIKWNEEMKYKKFLRIIEETGKQFHWKISKSCCSFDVGWWSMSWNCKLRIWFALSTSIWVPRMISREGVHDWTWNLCLQSVKFHSMRVRFLKNSTVDVVVLKTILVGNSSWQELISARAVRLFLKRYDSAFDYRMRHTFAMTTTRIASCKIIQQNPYDNVVRVLMVVSHGR